MTRDRPPRHEALRIHGALSRGAFAVSVLVSLAVLFAPGSDVPTAPPGVDKGVHGLLFVVLAFTACWAGLPRMAAAVLLVLYATASEVIQGIAPLGRSASVADWVADIAGLMAGIFVWALVSGRGPWRSPTTR